MRLQQYVLGVLAMCAAACSPASDPAAPQAAEPETVAPEAPEPVAPEPDATSANTQGASMQGGNDHGGNNPGAGQSQANALDPRLVGTWVNEKQINSGGGAGGFASFSTVMTMVLNGDGTIQQFTQSVGGGGDWSSNSGRTMDFDGTWRAGNGTLLVHGMGLPDYTPAATYTFSGDYLVTQSDMGRLIWQRR